MSANSDKYPLVDFSDLPGCQSPATAATVSSSKISNCSSTKSRISSIFSMSSSKFNDSDDDPFDLKASARKARPPPSSSLKQIDKTSVNTGLLVDIIGVGAELNLIREEEDDSNKENVVSSGNCALTDWDKLKTEAQALAGDLKSNTGDNIGDRLFGSPLLNAISSPLMLPNSDSSSFKLVDDISSPEPSPVKSLKFPEPKHEKITLDEVFLDDQLEKAITKSPPILDEVFLDDQLEEAIKKSPTFRKQQPPKPETARVKSATSYSSKMGATPVSVKRSNPKPAPATTRRSLMPAANPTTSSRSTPLKPRLSTSTHSTPVIKGSLTKRVPLTGSRPATASKALVVKPPLGPTRRSILAATPKTAPTSSRTTTAATSTPAHTPAHAGIPLSRTLGSVTKSTPVRPSLPTRTAATPATPLPTRTTTATAATRRRSGIPTPALAATSKRSATTTNTLTSSRPPLSQNRQLLGQSLSKNQNMAAGRATRSAVQVASNGQTFK